MKRRGGPRRGGDGERPRRRRGVGPGRRRRTFREAAGAAADTRLSREAIRSVSARAAAPINGVVGVPDRRPHHPTFFFLRIRRARRDCAHEQPERRSASSGGDHRARRGARVSKRRCALPAARPRPVRAGPWRGSGRRRRWNLRAPVDEIRARDPGFELELNTCSAAEMIFLQAKRGVQQNDAAAVRPLPQRSHVRHLLRDDRGAETKTRHQHALPREPERAGRARRKRRLRGRRAAHRDPFRSRVPRQDAERCKSSALRRRRRSAPRRGAGRSLAARTRARP